MEEDEDEKGLREKSPVAVRISEKSKMLGCSGRFSRKREKGFLQSCSEDDVLNWEPPSNFIMKLEVVALSLIIWPLVHGSTSFSVGNVYSSELPVSVLGFPTAVDMNRLLLDTERSSKGGNVFPAGEVESSELVEEVFVLGDAAVFLVLRRGLVGEAGFREWVDEGWTASMIRSLILLTNGIIFFLLEPS